jgi:ADP-dependent NAD(P)H-hydrate dehydratase / NAD(P)H-hydrate epimerase
LIAKIAILPSSQQLMSNTYQGGKILSPEQIKQWDEYTVLHEPIASVDLMERASHAFVEEFVKLYPKTKQVAVICGLGNNGGDGLAIARMLLEKGYRVDAWVVQHSTTSSKDFKTNLHRLETLLDVHHISSPRDLPTLNLDTVLIDAILGSGLNRPLTGLPSEVIGWMNAQKFDIVSVDIASGLYASKSVQEQAIVQPTHTLSFQLPKLAFLLPQNHFYTGKFKILDIGLSPSFLKNVLCNHFYVEKADVKPILKDRPKFSHKGMYGHVLLFAGSEGKMGAALLASKAALQTGCGLLSVLVHKSQMPIVQTSVWEAMCIPYSSSLEVPGLMENSIYTVAVGPGIGRSDEAKSVLQYLFEQSTKPMLIDADAINILASNPDLIALVPPHSVLTPHPKEFTRLVGDWQDDFDRLEMQKEFSRKHQFIVVLKGAHTSISTPEGFVYFNSTGNPGMATAGSGDVLSGIITSLMAQNYAPDRAAILAVYLHGLAGDLAAEELGEQSLIASDIVAKLPAAFLNLAEV